MIHSDLNIKASLRGEAPRSVTHRFGQQSEQQQRGGQDCSASAHLVLLFLALMSLVRYVCGIPRVWIYVLINVRVHVCVGLRFIYHGCAFLSLAHTLDLFFHLPQSKPK